MERLPISVCMIAKNEQAVIKDALCSVRPYVRQIVVMDTGSTDDTAAIARAHADRVCSFEWRDDFAAARNACAAQADFGWVFALDADETVVRWDAAAMAALLQNTASLGCAVLRNVTQEDTAFSVTRLYHTSHYAYQGLVHETLVPLCGERTLARLPVELLHSGYLPQTVEAQNKQARNHSLLRKALREHPDDPYLHYQLGKHYSFGGRDVRQAIACFEQALRYAPDIRLEYAIDLYESYGNALLSTQQYEKALKLTHDLLRSGSPRLRFLCGVIYMNNGLLEQAIDCFRRCIIPGSSEGVSSYMPRYNIGVILELAGQPQQAAQFYRACGEYPPARQRLQTPQ